MKTYKNGLVKLLRAQAENHLNNAKYYALFALLIIALYAKFLSKTGRAAKMSDWHILYQLGCVWIGAFVINMIVADIYEFVAPHVLKIVTKKYR